MYYCKDFLDNQGKTLDNKFKQYETDGTIHKSLPRKKKSKKKEASS
jgi:hypothetical protein